MVVLQTLLGAASFAGLAAAVATVPPPSTGQAQLSSQLKEREINRMDIIRRASRMKKRQGPSAVPAPPEVASCGEFLPGQQFYVSIPDPEDETRYNYLYTSSGDIDNFGVAAFAFTDVELAATPLVFNDACEITVTGNINEGRAFVDSARTYIEVRLGTESYISQEPGSAVSCINQDGFLRCGTDEGWLPIASTQFCLSTSGTLQLTSSDPSVYGCAPISLSMSTSPPPQALPRCGDYPINTPLYLSGPNPQNPANSVIYGRAEDGNINFSGSSPLYRTDMSTMATPFIFDEQCSLIRITAAGTRATSTIGSGVSNGIPAFQTDAILEQPGRDILTCASQDGNLQCVSPTITAEVSRFCVFGNLYFMLTGTTVADCTPINLAVTSVPPVIPPPP